MSVGSPAIGDSADAPSLGAVVSGAAWRVWGSPPLGSAHRKLAALHRSRSQLRMLHNDIPDVLGPERYWDLPPFGDG